MQNLRSEQLPLSRLSCVSVGELWICPYPRMESLHQNDTSLQTPKWLFDYAYRKKQLDDVNVFESAVRCNLMKISIYLDETSSKYVVTTRREEQYK